MKRFLTICFVLLMLFATMAVGSAVALYMWAAQDLPEFTKITDYNPPLVTTVYTRNNEVLGYFYREKRFLVTLDKMPDHLPKAFLAAEDSSFFEHEGIDFMAIMRAFVKNLEAGEIRQGGSTITQQIIKQLLLTSEKKYERKLKEAILAYRLERYLSKEDILTIYLNQIFLGAHSYGVEAAARSYFGKHVGELTLAESAILAGLPQAPSDYDPYRHPDVAKGRQEYVLGQMLRLKWISQEEHDEAINQELVYKSMPDISWKQGAYYLEEVRRWLISYLSEENMASQGIELDKYGEDAVYELGLNVYTACDLTHQIAAERALRHGLEDSSQRRGWQGPVTHLEPGEYEEWLADHAVDLEELMDPEEWTLALVTAVSKQGATVRIGDQEAFIPVETMHWCRTPNPRLATDYVASITDATKVVEVGDVVWAAAVIEEEEGSPPKLSRDENNVLQLALKQRPIVNGALVSMEPPTGEVVALVGGYSFDASHFNRATQAERQPGSAFKPIVYSTALDNGFTPASVVLDAPFVYEDPYTHKLWKPMNFGHDFAGPMVLRNALCKSKNLVTVRLAQQVGPERIVERAKALGLTPEFPAVLAIALGSVAVSPLNLVKAYSAFPRGGSTIDPVFVTSVQKAWGEEIYKNRPDIREVLSPQNAYIMCHLLKEVVQAGTGTKAKVLGRPVAGKTGTTNDEQDAWFMGFSPYLLTGVYVGFDQVQPMGKLETGSRAALPIWVEYRQQVEELYELQDFPKPPGIVFAAVDPNTGGLAHEGGDALYLPFVAGTEPTTAQGVWAGEGWPAVDNGQPGDSTTPPSSGEDLFKTMF